MLDYILYYFKKYFILTISLIFRKEIELEWTSIQIVKTDYESLLFHSVECEFYSHIYI